jgi:hypothetical protein
MLQDAIKIESKDANKLPSVGQILLRVSGALDRKGERANLPWLTCGIVPIDESRIAC